MTGLGLAELRNAYQEWMGAPTKTIHLRHAGGPEEGIPGELDIHIFEEAGDAPFACVVTAGMSLQELTGPVPRAELALVVAGRFDDTQLDALGRRLGELAVHPFRQRSFFAPNMVVGEFSLPLFDNMTYLLLADFNIRSADYLPIDPVVRILRVTPLFKAEADIARAIGDVDIYHRFQVEAVNHEAPRRHQAALAEPQRRAAPSRDTTAAIDDLWNDIDNWLRSHAAPTLNALRPGADDRSLDQLELGLGLQLPPDYRLSLKRHDGRAYLTDHEYLSSAQVISIWSSKKAAFDRGEFTGREVEDKGGSLIRNFWWHPGWIPFAEDSAGNLLCIDTVPGWQGSTGQILRWEREEGPFPGPGTSFSDWLRTYRDDLLAGKRFEVDRDGLIRSRP